MGQPPHLRPQAPRSVWMCEAFTLRESEHNALCGFAAFEPFTDRREGTRARTKGERERGHSLTGQDAVSRSDCLDVLLRLSRRSCGFESRCPRHLSTLLPTRRGEGVHIRSVYAHGGHGALSDSPGWPRDARVVTTRTPPPGLLETRGRVGSGSGRMDVDSRSGCQGVLLRTTHAQRPHTCVASHLGAGQGAGPQG